MVRKILVFWAPYAALAVRARSVAWIALLAPVHPPLQAVVAF